MTKSIDGQRQGSKAYHEAMQAYVASDPPDHLAGEKAISAGQACGLISPGSAAFVLAAGVIQHIRGEIRKMDKAEYAAWMRRYQNMILLMDGWKVGDKVSVYNDGTYLGIPFEAVVRLIDDALSRLKVIYTADGSEQWVPMEWCSLKERPS
jgi:hypothetical protein